MDMNDYPKMDFAFIKDLNRIYHSKKIILNDLGSLHNEKNAIRVRAKHTPFYENNFHQLVNDLKKYDHYTTVLITIENEKRFEAFYDQLESLIDLKRLGKNDTLFPKRINIIRGDVHNAFEWFDTNLIVLNESAIYHETEKKKPKYKSVFKDTKKISHVKQLEKGDHIVHYDHGIGRFLEIKTMEVSNHTNDYIVIQYRGEDTLYIPVENIHLLQKYVAHEGIHPKLNKLGSAEWAKTKSRVRKKAKDIAANLIKLYAEREHVEGFAFSEDNDLTDIFEADFLYEETEDQQKAIDDVKRDMESKRPMDRLICGDVGYGKTEVALRAAFKAALDNKQTAYLAPTTVLARQHYYTFKDRLEKHGIKCALLNRFVTKANQKKVIQKLKKGEVDVVLGTHRLLSKDIVFKDLGLLIIDEEQRFGVEHKEKIKQLKSHVDVISLSATPIPRTLQMAMTGVKQMSLLETPPKNRLPIQTYVLQRNDHVIKDAVERELARGGQIFYLYNRVDTIAHVKTSLERLIPDANIGFAHGKMSRLKLEQMIEDFLDHKFDVLVSTTIIETGIDIPNANTLIIHDADKLGLSQLYQIRGRVGRSNRIAYSYLMYDKNKQLKEEAVKRLQVIKEFTELGSGYKIALRDLAIRGAGDILGTEQSGFIDSVGIDLFLEMLKEEIDKEKDKDKPTVQAKESAKQTIKFDVDKSIPSNYIANDDLKLDMHKRISALDSSNEYLLLKEELEDRFGEIPVKLSRYMQEKLYENLAVTKGIERTLDKQNTVRFIFSEKASSNINGERLFAKVDELSPFIHLSYKKNKVNIELEKHKLDHHFITYIITLLETI
jgi:transcription-repair coupling factor (superfamily II helicase)